VQTLAVLRRFLVSSMAVLRVRPKAAKYNHSEGVHVEEPKAELSHQRQLNGDERKRTKAVETKEQALDFQKLDEIIADKGSERGALIPVLQEAQEAYGYLPKEILKEIARRLKLPLSRVYGVATFYSQFYLTRRGKNVIKLCDGTACHVKGAAKSIEYLKKEKNLAPGTTSPDYEYTLEVVYCLGACALSPVVMVNGRPYRQATPERIKQILDGPLS